MSTVSLSTSIAETPLGPFAEFWYSFKANRAAVFGLLLILIILFLALFAPWLAPYAPDQIHDGVLRKPPFWVSEGSHPSHWLGTDDLGRDLLSRLLYGARISMGVGLMVSLVSASLGTLLGVWAGYRGGLVDSTIMRWMDILMSFPSILLSIVVVSILGPGLVNAIWAVSIVAMPGFVRLSRASVMAEKNKQYVTVSKSLGASGWRQAFINIFPNCLAPIIVQTTMAFSDGILNAAALGFLGLGAQPPQAEWGTMLSDARSFIESSPWLVTLPGLCILTVVLAFNLLGDGLRDAFDPKLKR